MADLDQITASLRDRTDALDRQLCHVERVDQEHAARMSAIHARRFGT
jgi:hypothetical protein